MIELPSGAMRAWHERAEALFGGPPMNICSPAVYQCRRASCSLINRLTTFSLAVAITLGLLSDAGGLAAEVDSTWGGLIGMWNDATKWNPNQVPNNTPNDTFNVAFNSGSAEMSSNIDIEKFNFDGGIIKSDDPLNKNYTLTAHKKTTWTAGTIDSSITLTAEGDIDIGPQGATKPTLNGKLLNKGAAMLNGTELATTNSGVVQNSGTFSLQPNASISTGFDNKKDAKFIKLAGGGANPIKVGGPFLNRGTVELRTGGTIEFNSFAQFEGQTVVEAGATMKSPNNLNFFDGQLTGLGIVEAPNVSAMGSLKASLASDAKFEIRGNLNLSGPTVSDSGVGGPGMNPDYASLIAVSGNAHLEGTLRIEVWPGYVPNPDFEYYIMTVDGLISGFFTNALDGQRINTVGNEGSFVVHYGSPGYEHEVSLEDFGPAIVPEPASFCLWGVWFLGWLFVGSVRSR
jgi:hypothetical protein